MSSSRNQQSSHVEQEIFKVLSATFLLVIVQVILNTLGWGGMTYAIAMYIAAVAGSSMLIIDLHGIRPNTDDELSAFQYLIRAGIDFVSVLVGFFLWFMATIRHGFNKSADAIQEDPEKTFREITSNSAFLSKLMYAGISHLTFFAICEFFVNFSSAIKGLFRRRQV